jgi:non-canonical poly(A) RNA polymerase PAPD5/7
VPIIKFVYTKNNLHFDIAVNKFDGLNQLKEISQALKIYPQLRHLIFVNKCILKQRELSETFTGGVGSFLLFSMLLCYLRETGKRQWLLSDYLLGFFEFYGERTWSDKRIYMK